MYFLTYSFTSITFVAKTSPALAVIVTLPALIAFTTPKLLTVAIFSLEEVQVTPALFINSPNWSLTVATNSISLVV